MSPLFNRFVSSAQRAERFFRKQKEAVAPPSTWATCHVWLMVLCNSIRPVFRTTDNRFIGDALILTNSQESLSDEDENSPKPGQTTVKPKGKIRCRPLKRNLKAAVIVHLYYSQQESEIIQERRRIVEVSPWKLLSCKIYYHQRRGCALNLSGLPHCTTNTTRSLYSCLVFGTREQPNTLFRSNK